MTRNAKKIRRDPDAYNRKVAVMREANALNSYYAHHGGRSSVEMDSRSRDLIARTWWKDYLKREFSERVWMREWLLDMAAGE